MVSTACRTAKEDIEKSKEFMKGIRPECIFLFTYAAFLNETL